MTVVKLSWTLCIALTAGVSLHNMMVQGYYAPEVPEYFQCLTVLSLSDRRAVLYYGKGSLLNNLFRQGAVFRKKSLFILQVVILGLCVKLTDVSRQLPRFFIAL